MKSIVVLLIFGLISVQGSLCPGTGVRKIPVEVSPMLYLECINGVFQNIRNCPLGYAFDPASEQCQPEQIKRLMLPSGTSIQCPATVDSRVEPVYLTHPTDCTIYYICLNFVPQEQRCPPNTAFNPQINLCDVPENANCAH
ncbi:peritrophin-1-like [Uranotaenia lowii]|uniref:peritrophin-1-like n=1 Tax=Uranotaenia lowii TaxID=190385 RepID=UPI00247AA8A2|nr:peritrophin-1-like [Uranotaenia lowii]